MVQEAKRAALYERVSVASDMSIKRQDKLLTALAKREGYNVVGTFADDGISGFKQLKREDFEGLKDLILSDGVDVVLATTLDRLDRDSDEFFDFRVMCHKHGVVFHFEDHGVKDPSKDKLVLYVTSYAAEQESRAKQLRLQHSNDERAASGTPHPSSRRAFGYSADRVTPHPVEAAFVTEAFKDYAAGSVTIGEIRRRWNDAGLTTTTGKPFLSGAVGLILRNPRYAGYRVHRGQIVEGVTGAWEPLTDPETFAKCQARLASRKGTNTREVIPTTLLGGIATCHCGQVLRPAHGGRKRKDGTVVRMYRCNRYLLDRDGRHVVVTAQRLDDHVTRVVADEFLIGHVADDQLVEAYGQPEVKKLETELADLKEQDALVLAGYEAKLYTVTEAAKRRAELAKEISGIETRLAAVRGAQVDRAWIERAREIAAQSDALTLDAAVVEFNKLSLADRRGLIGSLFTVQVFPSTSSTPIDDRTLVFFKGQPNFAASKPAQILQESK